MMDKFCQTLTGHLGVFSYITEPVPNTFTSNVPVKLNKRTLPYAQKVNTLNYGLADQGGKALPYCQGFWIGLLD